VGALAFGVNGLFMALAHFAVYDVAALTALAVAMWLAARGSVTLAALAFAGAVVAKFGHVIMVVRCWGSSSPRGTSPAPSERSRYFSPSPGDPDHLLLADIRIPASHVAGDVLPADIRRARAHIASAPGDLRASFPWRWPLRARSWRGGAASVCWS
jgi:hypothetical protein